MDVEISNGTILTMTSQKASAISVKNGRIHSLSKSKTEPETKIDLDGKTILPGFIDCHTHFISMGLKKVNVDLSNTKSVSEAVRLLEDGASQKEPAEWVKGHSWDESTWSEPRYLSPDDISHIENPIYAVRIDGHMAVLNTKAQKVLNIKKGFLYEDELFKLHTALPEQDAEQAFEAAKTMAHQQGVTSIHDNPMDIAHFTVYQKNHNQLRIYVNFPVSVLDEVNTLGLHTGFGNEWLKFGGIKIFTDGSIGAKTAAISFNYRNEENNGVLIYSDEELCTILKNAHPNQTAIHAIGDRAIQQVLTCSVPGTRNRIEHAELVRDDQIPHIKELGLILSMQPNFFQWSHPGGLYDTRFGTGLDNRIHVLHTQGIPIVFGSDCMPFSPLYGIEQVVNAPFEDQKLSVMDALKMYTKNGAYASFEEDMKGTIKPGKVADFVVLSGDPREEEISQLTVDMTIVGGEIVYP